MNFKQKLLAVATPIALGLTAIQIEGELFTLGNILSNVSSAGLVMGVAAAAAYAGYKAIGLLVGVGMKAVTIGHEAADNIVNTNTHVLSSAKSYIPSSFRSGDKQLVQDSADSDKEIVEETTEKKVVTLK